MRATAAAIMALRCPGGAGHEMRERFSDTQNANCGRRHVYLLGAIVKISLALRLSHGRLRGYLFEFYDLLFIIDRSHDAAACCAPAVCMRNCGLRERGMESR